MNGRSRKRLIEVAFPLEEVSAPLKAREQGPPRPHLRPPHLVGAPPPSRLSRLHLRITRR